MALDVHPNERIKVLATYTCGQRDLVFEQRHHDCGEFAYPPFDHHLISIHIGAPVTVEHSSAGHLKTTTMRTGSVTLLPAGLAGTWRGYDGADFLNLQVKPTFFERIMAQTRGLAADQIELADTFDVADPRLESLGLLLSAEAQIGMANGPLYVESLATAVAVHLAQNYTRTTTTRAAKAAVPTRAQLQTVVAYMHEHLTSQITLAELAEQAGLSQNYLVTQFRQLTGLAPHQYLIAHRIERAQQLLLRSDMPLSEVATTVGFADQSHLTRHMRRLHGITPAAFRRQHRKNVPQTP